MQRAVVTGANGFLGFHIVMLLSQQGWFVRALHRAEADIRDLSALDNVECYPVDYEETEQIKLALDSEFDVCFHVLGDTNLWSRNNKKQYKVNVLITQKIAAAVLSNKIPRLIHTSSISAFGFHDKTITEATISNALQSGVNYLVTKYLGEHVVKEAIARQGLDAVILNPCAIIGSHDKHNWSRLFSMVNDGSLPGIPPGQGSYCHVTDVAQAHITAYEKGKTGHNYILAGTDSSFEQVINIIAGLLNKPISTKVTPAWLIRVLGFWGSFVGKFRQREPSMTMEKSKMVTKRVVANCDKAKRELDYQGNVNINEMLEDCFAWLKKTGRI